ncbi:MAG: hypothetical protein QOH12_2522 [Solirubrobacteraceae bacterium]|jgi:hypothetical protein|nr:hypothetical protein [Solirubrobacteraceae bacterium]
MPQRPETPLKDLAGALRTIIRSNKAAAEALGQIQEIETLAEDRLRPLMPELRVIKDDALAAARELDTAKLSELPFRLRDLVIRAGQDKPPADAEAAADAATANGTPDSAIGAPETGNGARETANGAIETANAAAAAAKPASAAEDLLDGHTSYPTDRILPLAAPPNDPGADISLNSPKHVAEALFQLHELLVAGVLDQVEHDAKKRELLDRL